MFCKSCGTSIEEGSVFCSMCGKPVGTTEPVTKHRSSLGLRLVVVVATLLMGIGAVYYYATGSKGNSSVQPSNGLNPSSGSTLNTNAPSYVKSVAAYKEGTGAFVVYFILADANGAMTTSDGNATLTVFDSSAIYTVKRFVRASDFVETQAGQGAFARDVIIYNFGRITYTAFDRYPTNLSGTVRVEFIPTGGKNMWGDETIIFDR